jgi:hypothetical protein
MRPSTSDTDINMQEDPAKLELLRMTYPYEELSSMKEEDNLSGMNAALIDFYFFQISNWNPTSDREWNPAVTQEETLVAEFLLPNALSFTGHRGFLLQVLCRRACLESDAFHLCSQV